MSRFDEVITMMDDGLKGNNRGLPHGLHRFRQLVPNIQKGTYFAIGGEPGSGKTAFTDNCFLFAPYDYIIDKTIISLKVIYFSLEIDYKYKLLKAIGRRMFLDHGTPYGINKLLSRGKFTLPKEIRKLVDNYRGYFEQLEDILDIYDEPHSPEEIRKVLKKYVEENGKWRMDKNGNPKWYPNNPHKYVIVIVDHVGLISGGNKKEAIDRLSRDLIYYRNKCGIIPVVVSQFNRTISSSDRFKIERVEPQLSDFKDTASTQEDANIVLGLFNPDRYNIGTYHNYKTNKLTNSFRALHVLKNRDGIDNGVVGLKFQGEVGHFEEYPRPEEMNYE